MKIRAFVLKLQLIFFFTLNNQHISYGHDIWKVLFVDWFILTLNMNVLLGGKKYMFLIARWLEDEGRTNMEFVYNRITAQQCPCIFRKESFLSFFYLILIIFLWLLYYLKRVNLRIIKSPFSQLYKFEKSRLVGNCYT